MRYVELTKDAKLTDLANYVGTRNVDTILHINGLDRTPYIGRAMVESQGNTILNSKPVDYQRKLTLLNSLTDDYDLYQLAATMGDAGWKLLSNRSTFPNMLKIPEGTKVPDSSVIWGNGVKVPNRIYSQTQIQIASEETGHTVDPSVFNEYSPVTSNKIVEGSGLPYDTNYSNGSNMGRGGYFLPQWFPIPWGEVTLYSSLNHSDYDNLHHDHEDFPVYPEEVSDSIKANYSQMPDLIYQYEPWQLYTGSGPRSNTYKFTFHRDMWTGDHRDGGANRLIRFCQANCYPKYKGSSVQTSIVTLYVSGKNLITGVLESVDVDWSGPLGLDGWYLVCDLSLTITEVSPVALDFDTVRTKPLIG